MFQGLEVMCQRTASNGWLRTAMKQPRSALCNHASYGIPTSTKKQKYPRPNGTRSWAAPTNSKHFFKTTFTMELPLWTVSQPQLRPQRRSSEESAWSGRIFVQWVTPRTNITDHTIWKRWGRILGLFRWPRINAYFLCLAFWQGRLLMERCGVLPLISREETLPTHRSAWTATLTRPTFMSRVGKCNHRDK